MQIDPEILAHVERGALMLDEHIPGWAERIDTARLDIDHPSHCVLGQLGGGTTPWTRMTDVAASPLPEQVCERPDEYGFALRSCWYLDLVNEAWRREIRARTTRAGRRERVRLEVAQV